VSKARALRELLARPGLVAAVGAHDALSARLIEAAGFPLVWSSSFTVSAAQRALPDVNLLTMTETLEAARHINAAVSVPVIADGDNGYGNAVNVVRTVQEYERAGIAGLCLEDNVFPKKCSLYPGMRRELASVEEHAGKIRAAKRAQRDPDTVIIARTEAFIAGWGLDEALRRAHAYADAGADMILVHSKAPTPAEILAFMRRWDRPTPVVVVPTLYPSVTWEELERAGVKLVIWANHVLRAAVRGMQTALAVLRRERRLDALDPHVVELDEIYRHVGVEEVRRLEDEFLPRGVSDVRAVILAAGAGKSLLPLTETRPKCMLDIKGRTVLERQLETLRACGIHEIAVVRGYRREAVTAAGVRFYDNEAYDETGEVVSLLSAEPDLRGRVLVLYGDVLFERGLLERLLRAEGDVVIVVDRTWVDQRDQRLPLTKPVDLVVTSDPPRPGRRALAEEWHDQLLAIGQRLPPEAATGEFIGLTLLSSRGVELLREVAARALRTDPAPLHEAPSARQAALTDLLQALVAAGHPVTCVSTWKGWLEIDTFEDYQRAWAEIRT
jgi:phosphoenolpyruvate phosphomutase